MEWVTERYKLVYNAETKRAVSRWGIWTGRKREWEEEKGGGRGRLATELEGSKKKRGRRGRKRAAHNGLILTFLWGPVLPVSFQMNGNCPAGFNHVLNWEREKKRRRRKRKKKKRRKVLLRRLRIDRSGSRPIATPLYPPSHKYAPWCKHTNILWASRFVTTTH